jgi:nucleoside 2-deoxyribosyltransferase
MTKPMVYIASPYTLGDVAENVANSIRVADALVRFGFIPFAPLLSHFWQMISPHPHEYWIALDLEWVKRADAVLRMFGESKGAGCRMGAGGCPSLA